LGTRLTCNALFLKSPIFLIRVDIDKENPKNKKNQIYKKKKRVEGPSWKPSNIFTYKYLSPQHTQEGRAILHFWETTQTKP
jgi:hypothetical protein